VVGGGSPCEALLKRAAAYTLTMAEAGETIVVTGGSGGFGLFVIPELVAAGYSVRDLTLKNYYWPPSARSCATHG
jgi:hypothetical protein